MSVRIEILDYKYVQGNILTWSNSSVDGWNTGTGINTDTTGVGVKIESTAGTSFQFSGFYSSSLSLINGNSYTLTYYCNGVSNNQQGNSKVFLMGAGAGLNAYRPIGNQPITAGTHSYTFTMDESLNNSEATMQVYFELTNGNSANKAIRISNVKLVNNSVLDTIDWDNSVVGELDITDHSDFPLAMTFQISDFKDITSTSGDYSKTFKFPATKNNNNILKHLYIPNINNANNITERKPCRIISGGMYTQLGLIRITGVGGYGKVPSSYSGVFYGNNLTWASDLGDAYMNQLEWGVDGENLEYNKTSIMATWQDEDCNSNPNSYIVYPITSYGQYNAEGTERTIQLLDTVYGFATDPANILKTGYYGFDNAGNDYGTPSPNPDWRPAVFVKNTLDKLFDSVGYRISSAFMDTAEFKKNVWLLPNFKYNSPDDRVTLYATKTSFTNNVDLSVGSSPGLPAIPTEDGVVRIFNNNLDENDGNYYYNGAGRVVLDIDNISSNPSSYNISVALDNSSNLNFTNDYILVPEYGYYDINLGGLETKVARVYKGGDDIRMVHRIWSRVAVEVQTVGQSGSSSWVAIGASNNEMVINQDVNINIDANTPYQDMSSVNIERRFFNKGDKIRITTGLKITAQTNSQNFIVYIFVKSKGTSSFLNLSIDPNNVAYGQTYNLKDVMNPDYTQIDFIKGIAHAYNLQMTTDESTRTVHIEPFNSFYKPYRDAVDWTSKLSRADETTDKWIENELKRSLVFKYKSDSADGKVKFRGVRFFDGVEDEYPYRETLPDSFEKGDSTFENPFFAGTHNTKDMATTGTPNVDTAYSACLWRENVSSNDTGRPDKGFDFLPRLLYWNKYSPATAINLNKKAVVQTWSATYKGIVASANLTPMGSILSDIYPQATMVNRDNTLYTDVNGNTLGTYSPILSYGNVWVRDYDDATGLYTSYQAGKGLYDTYYRSMVEMLKRNPRLRTVSLDLKVTDIINLDFRKLVYIDGVYWRINRVVDYMPNNNSTTKVELIEWFQIGIFAATTPALGSSGSETEWGDGGALSHTEVSNPPR